MATDLTQPAPELRFRWRVHPIRSLRELWAMRELVLTLAERDLRARYKQTALGFAWAILTPVALMVVFSVFFQRAAKIDTHGIPYPLFSYVALLPWTFFSSCVTNGGMSLVTNAQLLNKVYCPREVFPLATMLEAGFDTLVACTGLAGLFVIFSFMPKGTAVWVPLLVVIQLAFTAGVTVLLSGVLVYVRDLRYVLPIIMQLGLFATPVAYPISLIPVHVQVLYSYLNPLAPIIDGYRRVVLLGRPPDFHLLVPAIITTLVMLTFGYWLFKRLEVGLADAA